MPEPLLQENQIYVPLELAEHVQAPLRGHSGNRSPALLREIPKQLFGQPRYMKRDITGDQIDETFCNIWVIDCLELMGVRIPRLKVNKLADYFAEEKDGWTKVMPWVAKDLVRHTGCPVVPIWKNLGDRSGHMGLCQPPKNDGDASALWICQAGISNFLYGRIEQGFGAVKPVYLYAHP